MSLALQSQNRQESDGVTSIEKTLTTGPDVEPSMSNLNSREDVSSIIDFGSSSVVSESPIKVSGKKFDDGNLNLRNNGSTKKAVKDNVPSLHEQQYQSMTKKAAIKDIVMGRKGMSSTLTRNLSVDVSIGSSADNGRVSRDDRSFGEKFQNPNGSSIIIDAKPGHVILTPHPNDILFPLEGMNQWPGNEMFLSKIEASRRKFLSCTNRSEQAKIALKIVKDVVSSVDRRIHPGVRFLTRNRTESSSPRVLIGHWVVMDETSVLIELGRALRGEHNDDKKHKMKTNVDDQTPALKRHKFTGTGQSCGQVGKSVFEHNSDHDPLGPLKAVYNLSLLNRALHKPKLAKPSVPLARVEIEAEKDDIQAMLFTIASKDENNLKPNPHFMKKNNSKPVNQNDVAAAKLANPSVQVATIESESEKFDSQEISITKSVSKDENNLKSSRRSTKKINSMNVKQNEGAVATVKKTKKKKLPHQATDCGYTSSECPWGIPKGVTVRPSGKWQAQTYFSGQSRYVGVYNTNVLAAHAYRVVQMQLKANSRRMEALGRSYNQCSKAELAEIFLAARLVAEKSVEDLHALIAANKYEPMTTEQKLLAQLDESQGEK